jgi:mono/diheme cytochrome c family protein
MKKILFASLVALAAAVACTPKAVPTTSTPASSSSTASTTPADEPVKSKTAASATIEAGHTIYTSKCGRCHGLKEVGNYTAERWVPILNSMAPKAKLTEDETAQVLAYVQANAKKS